MTHGTPPFVPHISNKVPANMGVVGTLGTSDTGGTARVLPMGVNDQTGAAYVENIGALSGVVLTTAVAVANGTATALPSSTLASRKAFIGYNNGTTDVYLGGTGVTGASDGIPVGTGDFTPSIDLGTAELYGVAAAAGGTIIVMEVS